MNLHAATLALLLAAPATAQIASDDFEMGNPNDWGVEFFQPATWDMAGGNPGGRIEVQIQSSMSMLPAAMIVPATVGHPFAGNFRALGATSFSFDRQVEAGSSNFGTLPFLVLGNDGGTPTDFLDDAWAFVYTGDAFQFGMVPWATISTPIPSTEMFLPMNWDVAALPNSPFAGNMPDDIWNSIIEDVDYVGIAMNRPFNGGAWFGAHILSLDNFVLDGTGPLGDRYCSPANQNASGQSAQIDIVGSPVVSMNTFTLEASQMPTGVFGFFLTSLDQGFVANPNGSLGNLCLGGAIGRYVGSGQVQFTGMAGAFSLPVDLTQMPQPTGFVSAMAGDEWNFQAWFRDNMGGMASSNFTDALSVDFQ